MTGGRRCPANDSTTDIESPDTHRAIPTRVIVIAIGLPSTSFCPDPPQTMPPFDSGEQFLSEGLPGAPAVPFKGTPLPTLEGSPPARVRTGSTYRITPSPIVIRPMLVRRSFFNYRFIDKRVASPIIWLVYLC